MGRINENEMDELQTQRPGDRQRKRKIMASRYEGQETQKEEGHSKESQKEKLERKREGEEKEEMKGGRGRERAVGDPE